MSPSAVAQNLEVLRQGIELLRALDRTVYATADGPARPAVGPHFRHCVDFYRSFLEGLEDGRVDYDRRRREARLEQDPQAAAAAFEEIAGRLARLPPERLDRPLAVVADLAPDEEPGGAAARSTVGRELRVLLSHTVHHWALIALALRARGLEPGAEFGVAPSTLAHWRRRRAAAPEAPPDGEGAVAPAGGSA